LRHYYFIRADKGDSMKPKLYSQTLPNTNATVIELKQERAILILRSIIKQQDELTKRLKAITEK
jgi:hypothetical protein